MDSISVVIGMDPHKRSATIEAMGLGEEVLGGGRFGTDPAGFEAMLAYAAAWQDRVWAVEGCEGIGKHLVLRLLADRRRRIGEDHTRMVCQLHQLLLELLPGGAKKDLSAAQARRLLAGVRPKDVAGKTRKRVALELVTDPGRLYRRKKGGEQGAHRPGQGHPHRAARPARHRTLRCRTAAGRGG